MNHLQVIAVILALLPYSAGASEKPCIGCVDVTGLGDYQDIGFSSEDPFEIAAFEGDIKAIEDLIKKGNDPSAGCAIGSAARRNHFKIIELLLKHGVEPDCLNGELSRKFPRWTPLFFSVNTKRFESALVLLGKGANPNYQPPKNWFENDSMLSNLVVFPPRNKEAVKSWENLVSALLENGADPNGLGIPGNSLPPLIRATYSGCEQKHEILKTLFAYGADPNFSAALGSIDNKPYPTATHFVLTKCSLDDLRLFTEFGALDESNYCKHLRTATSNWRPLEKEKIELLKSNRPRDVTCTPSP